MRRIRITRAKLVAALRPLTEVTRNYAEGARLYSGPVVTAVENAEALLRRVDSQRAAKQRPDPCPLCGEDRSHPSQHGQHRC